MPINPPPIQNAISTVSGELTQVWVLFFMKLRDVLSLNTPWQIMSATVSTLPDATAYEGSLLYVSNESGGKVVAFSDGINWRRVTDRAIVS